MTALASPARSGITAYLVVLPGVYCSQRSVTAEFVPAVSSALGPAR
jgi:hypothetical protein